MHTRNPAEHYGRCYPTCRRCFRRMIQATAPPWEIAITCIGRSPAVRLLRCPVTRRALQAVPKKEQRDATTMLPVR